MPPLGRYGQSIAELMMRQGEAQAANAQRSGMIWGRTIENITRSVGHGVEAYQQEKTRKRTEALFQEIVENPKTWENPQAGLMRMSSVIGPKPALEFFTGLAKLSEAQRKAAAQGQLGPVEALESLQAQARMARAMPGDSWQQLKPSLEQLATKAQMLQPGQEFTRDMLDAIDMGSREPGKPQSLSAGAGLYTPEGKLLAERPFKPEQPLEEKVREREMLAAATARGTETVAGPRREETAAKAAVKGETALRKEYTKQTKSAVDGIQAIDRFSKKPWEKMRRGEKLSPEDQFAMIYAFNKALDPTSVVREGEFRNTRQVGLGVHQEALLLLRKWQAGEQLTQDQVKGMMEVIRGTRQVLQQQIKDQDRYFTDLAVNYGFDPGRVVGGSSGYTGGDVIKFDAQGNMIPGE